MTDKRYILDDNKVREMTVNSIVAATGEPIFDDTLKAQISDTLSIFRGEQRELFSEQSDKPLPSPHAIDQADGHA